MDYMSWCAIPHPAPRTRNPSCWASKPPPCQMLYYQKYDDGCLFCRDRCLCTEERLSKNREKSITVRRSKNNPDDGRSSYYRCRLILVIENLVDLIIHIKTPSQRNYGMRIGGDGQVESGGKGVEGPCGETISLWTDSKMLPSPRRK